MAHAGTWTLWPLETVKSLELCTSGLRPMVAFWGLGCRGGDKVA